MSWHTVLEIVLSCKAFSASEHKTQAENGVRCGGKQFSDVREAVEQKSLEVTIHSILTHDFEIQFLQHFF